jgi:hypothetical protein
VSRRALCVAASIILTTLLLANCALGQFAQRGGVEGFVFDPSGAIIPGAAVTLTNTAQKNSAEVKADATGHFQFTSLPAGEYVLTASAGGFGTVTSEALTVNIGSSLRYDFRLTPGSVRQSVTVSTTSAALETGQSSVDSNISPQQMDELPLNGRNFTSIAALAPGVSTTPQLNINPGGTYAAGSFFASGGVVFTTGGQVEGSRDNGFYVNGVNITDNYESSLSYEPSAEALAQGTLQVADLSAANGRDVSTLAMQTKGGSSQFHGEAYDYLENDALNAVNPFDKAESAALLGTPALKPTLRRNQFGGGLGGPFFIPKLLPRLRDKAFFFANYENFIESDGSEPVYASVPSAAERTGDFSELLTGTSPLQLYNPFDTTYDSNGYSSRPVIPNNRLDLAARPDGSPVFNSASANLTSIYPEPNIPNTPSYLPNYATTQTLGFSVYHLDTRFDAHVTEKDSVFVTWSRSHGLNNDSGNLPPSQLYIANVDDRANLVTVNYARVFRANLTNEFIFGRGYGATQTLTPSEFAYYNSASNPFNKVFQNTGSGINLGVLALDVYNYASPGQNNPFYASNHTFQISDNLDWIKGRHTLAFGINYFRKGEYDWSFTRFVTFGESAYNSNTGGLSRQLFSSGGYDQNYIGGDGMADVVMGVPQVIFQRYNFTSGGPTAPQLNGVAPYWGMYVNDRFQATPKLTLSVGVRYDLSIPLYAPNSLCCAVYSPTSAGGVLSLPGIAPGLPQQYLSANKLDFAPRVSIAYSPVQNTVVRVGYGIFFDAGASQIAEELTNAGASAPGYTTGSQLTNVIEGVASDTPALGLNNIFQTAPNLQPGEFPVSTGTGQGYFGDGVEQQIYYFDQKSTVLPYYQRYLADIQQQITGSDSFTISYVGAQARKGSNYVNINLPPYATGWPTVNAFNAARPNNAGRFSDIYLQRGTLNTHYNAGIAQYQHVFHHGVQFLSNYTFGKTISDYPYYLGFQYPNLLNRGESTYSHRHRFVYSGIWQPVYGQSWSQWAKVPLTGWRISGIGTIESGDSLTIQNAETTANDYAGFDELFVSGSPNLGHSQKTLTQQFNTSAFTLPPNGVRGNSGLGTVRGPGQDNLDLSLGKTFPIFERFHLEFRADAFNSLNHAQWNSAQTVYPYAAVGNYGNIPFGSATGAREARIMQVALKLKF